MSVIQVLEYIVGLRYLRFSSTCMMLIHRILYGHLVSNWWTHLLWSCLHFTWYLSLTLSNWTSKPSTFVALPLAFGAPVTFARLNRASFMSHLFAPPPCRAGPSPWSALWYGMVSHWLSGHFLEYSPRNSFSNLKQHYSAALGFGALLSSPTWRGAI